MAGVAAPMSFGAPARASLVEGCRLAPHVANSCRFVATAPDEILVAGRFQWRVVVQHGDESTSYGDGDRGNCFLEGALYSGRKAAMCVHAIQPGDVVTAQAHGDGTVLIGNYLCANDPLCSDPYDPPAYRPRL